MKRKTALAALVVSLAAMGLIPLLIGLLVEAGMAAEKGTWPHNLGGFIVVAAMPVAFVAFLSCLFSVLAKLLLATMPRERVVQQLRIWPFRFLLWEEVRAES
jgi:hypothetical protein